MSIGFELAHHHLKETTPEAFQPILTSLYSELTLLGFIGLLMFTIFKLEILEELSKHLFGEGEEIKELGEQVHMVLFGVMALFLAQAVALAKFGEFIQRKWWRGGVFWLLFRCCIRTAWWRVARWRLQDRRDAIDAMHRTVSRKCSAQARLGVHASREQGG